MRGSLRRHSAKRALAILESVAHGADLPARRRPSPNVPPDASAPVVIGGDPMRDCLLSVESLAKSLSVDRGRIDYLLRSGSYVAPASTTTGAALFRLRDVPTIALRLGIRQPEGGWNVTAERNGRGGWDVNLTPRP